MAKRKGKERNKGWKKWREIEIEIKGKKTGRNK